MRLICLLRGSDLVRWAADHLVELATDLKNQGNVAMKQNEWCSARCVQIAFAKLSHIEMIFLRLSSLARRKYSQGLVQLETVTHEQNEETAGSEQDGIAAVGQLR